VLDNTEQNFCAYIIDSEWGDRRLDNTRSKPFSLQRVEHDRTVLDWALHSLSQCGIQKIIYVGGYHIQKVIERYPSLSYHFQTNWQQEGELAALSLARSNELTNCFILRAGVVCVPEALRRLTTSETRLGVGYYMDSSTRSFAGLLSLNQALVSEIFLLAETLVNKNPGANIEELLSAIEAEGLQPQLIDLDGLVAPVYDTAALSRVIFGGKGRTLEQVAPLIKSAAVLDQFRFKVTDWEIDSSSIVAMIQNTFGQIRVVVRSCAHAEDSLDESGAGRFESILDIPADQEEHLLDAINEVISSYTNNNRITHKMDEVLVQPHKGNLAASGVLLTRDLESGAPYYVLNIDRATGRSDVVTSGTQIGFDTHYISRNTDLATLTPDIKACLELARELENLTYQDSLDIEFGIDRARNLYLFQVRPIVGKAKKYKLADEDLVNELEKISEFLDPHFGPHPTLDGNTTVFGSMPDWNPAELLGSTPRPLALSLFQHLIGDRVWATARADIGYRDVRPSPLIYSLGGRPYVDVRASFNSFLPDGLDNQIASAWIDHGIQMLHENPSLHDKVEFNVAITCLAFDFDQHAQRLRLAGFNETAISAFRVHLLRLTDDILKSRTAPIDFQIAQLEELARRRNLWQHIPDAGTSGLARKINALIIDCKQYGTVPFSILARYAFIAMSLLRSLRTVGVLSDEEYETVLRSIPTVASDLSRDIAKLACGDMTTDVLLARYGHLRPSSLDITSPNYASAWETYVGRPSAEDVEVSYPDLDEAINIFSIHESQIKQLLETFGFTASVEQFQDFILRSIPGREWSKFEYMKSVDIVLESVGMVGDILGFSRDEMSFLPVEKIIRAATDSMTSAVQMEFRRIIAFYKKRWNLTSAIRLPHLIRKAEDVRAFQVEEWIPNFITSSRVVAAPVVFDDGVPDDSLDGKIVLIRAADPGYDWIFGHPIAGLITQYGGAGSHMAIRAAEFLLPAAIGCGEITFNKLRDARLVELDCTNKKVRAIS